ncbi:hypothetical protein [Methylosinus sporium]|nr:hypothetical protein [Methylosinus sporium]
MMLSFGGALKSAPPFFMPAIESSIIKRMCPRHYDDLLVRSLLETL